MNVSKERYGWKSFIRNRPTHASMTLKDVKSNDDHDNDDVSV